MKKTGKYLYIIFGLIIWIGCNNIASHNQSKNDGTTVNEVKTPNITSIKYPELIGLWVNSDYIKKLMKTRSITKTESNFDIFVSILFEEDNSVRTLEIDQMEPSLGKLDLENKRLIIEDQTYVFTIISDDSIRIKKDNISANYIRLSGKNEQGNFDGYNYLQTYLLLGDYKIIGIDSIKNAIISFKANNEVTGFLDYTHFYPSSFLENDIVMFDKEDDGHHSYHSFALKANDSGFILSELKEFDLDDEKLEYTGKKIRIEKIK